MPASEIFVDSGAWIALGDAGDTYHSPAIEAYRHLRNNRITLVTTNLVVAESYESIRRAGGYQSAIRFLASLRQSTTLHKVYADATLEDHAERILRHHDDQRFSFVDAVSFAVMRQRQIFDAFAFDHHFATAGFGLLPSTRG